MTAQRITTCIALLIAASTAGCSGTSSPTTAGSDANDPKAFLKQANDTINRLSMEASEATWVQQNFITQDTEALATRAN